MKIKIKRFVYGGGRKILRRELKVNFKERNVGQKCEISENGFLFLEV